MTTTPASRNAPKPCEGSLSPFYSDARGSLGRKGGGYPVTPPLQCYLHQYLNDAVLLTPLEFISVGE